MTRMLLITPRLNDPPIGGRELLSRLHIDCLRQLLGDELAVVELDRDRSSPTMFQMLRGYVDGLSPSVVADVVHRIDAERFGAVYLNGSNLGRLARTIREALPSTTILSFFHNVEARFFLGALRAKKNVRSLAVLLANHAAERDAVRASDRLIALNSRDSQGLERLYGRRATDILPMALEDRLLPLDGAPETRRTGEFLLFVGGAFYANVEGIRWFAREVAPAIRLRTRVIGRGLDCWRAELEAAGNVDVLGEVEDLQPHYLDAAAIVAPIFDGSGMKTKVAEALMYGKRIIGTEEAFRGYEAIAAEAGWICNGRDAFVAAVQEVQKVKPQRFDRSLRQLYESSYSRAATLSRLSKILGESGSCPI